MTALAARGSLWDPELKPDLIRIMDEIDARVLGAQSPATIRSEVMLSASMTHDKHYRVVFAPASVNKPLVQLRKIAEAIGVKKQDADACKNKTAVLQVIIDAIEGEEAEEEGEEDEIDATQPQKSVAPKRAASAAAASSDPARKFPDSLGLLGSHLAAAAQVRAGAAAALQLSRSLSAAQPLASADDADDSADEWDGVGLIDRSQSMPADSEEHSDREEHKESRSAAAAKSPRRSPRKPSVNSKAAAAQAALAANIAELEANLVRRFPAAARPRSGVSAAQAIKESAALGFSASAAAPSRGPARKASLKSAPKAARSLSFERPAASRKSKKRVESPEPSDSSSPSESDGSDDESEPSSSSEDDRRRSKKSKRASKSAPKKESKRSKRSKEKKHSKQIKRSKRRASPSSSSSDSDSSSSSDSDADPMLSSLKGDTIPERIARSIWRRLPGDSFKHWVEHVATFKSDRNRLEVLAWASAIDALHESLGARAWDEEAMELMVRRLLAVHSADSSNNWTLAKQLEMASRSDTLMPSSMLQRVFKNAAATQQLKAGGKAAGAGDWFSGSSRGGRSRGGGKSARGGRPSGAGDSSGQDRERSGSRPRNSGSGRGGRGGGRGGRSSSNSRAPGGAGARE
jgi:hypothetical protein